MEQDDERVSDLHVWSIGPDLHAAIVAVVSHHPRPPNDYRARIQTAKPSLVHVSVEVHACPID